MAFWVLSANKKEKLNQWFFAMTFFVILWVDFAFLGCNASKSSLATFFYRLNGCFVSLFLVSFYYFYIIYFLRQKDKHQILKKFILATGILLAFFSIFTNFIIKDTVIQLWGAEIIYNSGYGIFNLYAFIVALIVIGSLIKKYFKSPASEKLKIQYFLIGTFLFVLFNIVFNIITPSATGTVAYQHFGDYSAIFLLIFTAYAIVKHNLFGIKIILTATLVALIAILLTLDTLLFTTQLPIQALKAISLFIFLIFGYYLIKSVREEVKRREDAEILSRAKSEFISMASHQLRTPLTVIKGYVAMILGGSYGKIEPKAKRVLGNVSVSTERLIGIIEDLLDISRIELGKMDLEKSPTDIKETIDNICDEIEIKAKAKNLKLIWKKPKTLFPKINVDKLKIRQVIYNIVDNATKYTNKGKIEIKLLLEKRNILIIISDTGIGFDKTDKSKLFELFSRGKAGTDNFVQGTGMGLYVAKKFIVLHKGKIWAESEGENKGSNFYIELPLK